MEPNQKIVLILSYNRYPNHDAGAVRDMIFAQMYVKMGYRVICVGKGMENGNINGVEFQSASMPVNGLVGKFKQVKQYSAFVKNMMKQYKNEIAVIHILDISLSLIKYIKKHKEKDCQLVHDSVEWYSACEFKYGKLSRAYIHKDWLNRFVIDRKFKVISISRYLLRHYESKQIKTIRIPVLMNMNETKLNGCDGMEAERNIVYAGSPGKKDCLDIMLQGCIKFKKAEGQPNFKFHIIGVNEQQLEQYISMQDYELLKDMLVVHGRQSRDYVQNILNTADFTVLLRLDERYAHAGFSTKFVESLANGVPVICNLTSDMELYCRDGKNVITLQSASGDEFCESLKKYSEMPKEDIKQMSRYAKETAVECFDADLFYETFADFIRME